MADRSVRNETAVPLRPFASNVSVPRTSGSVASWPTACPFSLDAIAFGAALQIDLRAVTRLRRLGVECERPRRRLGARALAAPGERGGDDESGGGEEGECHY